ncbi:hypothetical protein HDK90DRAFT_224161 [Phyllosticta capitalensis]|uniref:Uncharacterized protein n=1 Tax=Phyllosticta capitalensis TaxID=121624 RepID=A0ABR1YTQ9_9PEZI
MLPVLECSRCTRILTRLPWLRSDPASRAREPILPPFPIQIERVTPTYEWPGPSKPPPQPRKRRDQAEAEPQDDDDQDDDDQEEGDADVEEEADAEATAYSSDDDHDQPSYSPSESPVTDTRTARDEELARMLQEEEYGGPPSNKRARLEVNYNSDDDIG